MPKPVGGRGIRAPYETMTIRIPVAIKDRVAQLAESYRNGTLDQPSELPTIDEAIEIAKSVQKQKKSGTKSLELLLKQLYKREISL